MALSTAAKAAVAAVALLAVGGVAVGAVAATGGLQPPTIEQVDAAWGEVTEETAVIELTVVLDNPNPVGVPPVAGVAYTAKLNDVVVAAGREGGLGLSSGTNEVVLEVAVRNDRIDDWWVTHINAGEQSTLTIEPAVTGPLGLRAPLPAQTQPVETDFLGTFGDDRPTTVRIQGEPFLTIGERTAAWGTATDDTTPLEFSARLTNRHDQPLVLDGLGYAVEMNNVVLGEGETADGLEVAPGASADLDLTARLRNDRIPDWWVSHLRSDEVTNLSVTVYGLVESDGGEVVEVPLVEQSATIETDLLGAGRTTVEPTDTGATLDVQPPTITGTTLEWGQVSDATTEVNAVVGIDNPNDDESLADLLTLVVDTTVTINGVTVAQGTSTVPDLPADEGEVTVTAVLDNARVPEWWAAHLNNGERSTVRYDASGHADVGVTAFPVDLPSQVRRFETDLLAGWNTDEPQSVTVRGTRVLTVEATTATWGEATPEVAPVDVTARVRNDGFADVTISDVSYEVTLAGVVLADDTAPGTWTVSPGETETIAIELVLDNTRMDEWWVAHLRHDETSTLDIEVYATVSAGGQSDRVRLDAISGNQTVETDILGGG